MGTLLKSWTLKGFKGQEKDIVILSCVRAGVGRSVGFLSDTRFVTFSGTGFKRMNVAITRAKSSHFILGNS